MTVSFDRFLRPLLAAVLLAAASAANAVPVVDPVDDFLPTYVGPREAALDITDANLELFQGRTMVFSAQLTGGFGQTPGLYAWILDRGAGTERLVSQTPSIGAGLFYDAVVSFNVFSVTTGGPVFVTVNLFELGGPTTRVTVSPFIFNHGIFFTLPASLFPSRGLNMSEYRWNMWAQAPFAGTQYISDFAADGHMASITADPVAAPIASTWWLLLAGFIALPLTRRLPTRRHEKTTRAF